MTLKSDPSNQAKLNLAPYFEAAANAVLKKVPELIDKHFDDQEGWDPLKPATIQERLRLKFPATPILVRPGSEVLRKNVASIVNLAKLSGTTITGSVEPNNSATTSYSKSPLGSYAAALNKQRPFFNLTDTDRATLRKTFIEAFHKARNG